MSLSYWFSSPRSVETNFMTALSSLPTRWLPPGNLRMLYHQWGREDVSWFSWNNESFDATWFVAKQFENWWLLLMDVIVFGWELRQLVIWLRYQQFWRTYDQHWRPLLKFLPPSTHGTCDDCTHFKELFRTTPAIWLHYELSTKFRPYPWNQVS